jgi:pectinesterase
VENSTTPSNSSAVQVCLDVLTVADDELTFIIALLNGTDPSTLDGPSWADIKVRLSAAMEMHTTCQDALQEVGATITPQTQSLFTQTNEIFSVALSFISLYAAVGDNFWAWARAAGLGGRRRRLLAAHESNNLDEIPTWVNAHQHRHLLATPPPGSYINFTVAWNGGGNYRKIMDAVRNAPTNSKQLFVIYIKAGTYSEQVTIASNQPNLMFIGDGIGKTIIQVNLSVALTPNMTTFLSPALSKAPCIFSDPITDSVASPVL